MKSFLKPVLLGLTLGLAPITGCALLYFSVPYLVDGNPGALLSFAVLGLYFLSSVVVFVFEVILLARNKMVMGGCALAAQGIQTVIIFNYLMNIQ